MRQFRKQMLTGSEFGGSVSVYAGELRSNSSGVPSRLVIFRTGAEAQRWKDGDRIDYEDLLKALSRSQVLVDTDVRQGAKVSYTLGGQRYVVDITKVEGAGLSQYVVMRILKD